MADEKVLITEGTLDNIAEAIREKNGESDLYYPNQMPAAIRRIPTGQGGGSVVAVYPILLSGEHIADIVVDGDRFALYAPEPIEYTAGTGIEISQSGVVSVSEAMRTTIAGKVDTTTFETAIASLVASVASKQDMLTAGSGITIQNNIISAAGTDVEANPTGTPTDELNTIRIGEDIYEIVGGGSGGETTELIEFGAGDGTTSRTFQLSKTPSMVVMSYFEGNDDTGWSSQYVLTWGSARAYGTGTGTPTSTSGESKTVGITYGADGKSFTITAANAGSALNTNTGHGYLLCFYNAGGGGASAMEDLTDVDLSNLTNGQVLKWNATTEKWENDDESGGGSSLPFEIVIDSNDNGINLLYEYEEV